VKYDKDSYMHITYKNIMSAIRYNMPSMRNFGVTFENLTCTHHPNWTRITCRFTPCITEPVELGSRWSGGQLFKTLFCTCLEGHHDFYTGVQTRNLPTRIRGRKTAVIVDSFYAMGSRRIRG